MKRSGFKQRTPMKKKQPKRDWRAAREKVEREDVCRAQHEECPTLRGCDCKETHGECMYACFGRLEAAHVVGRTVDLDSSVGGPRHLYGEPTYPVLPDRVVPLCIRHHKMYDAHEIDILHTLTLEEQLQAVRDADGLENARVRTAPSQYGRVRHGRARCGIEAALENIAARLDEPFSRRVAREALACDEKDEE